jgi:predicted ATPase
MIQTLHIENFKSLRDVTLHLGDVNILVGTNASGKSNILDAFRVLQGIGYGFTVDEIFNGKTKSTANEVWSGIRGGNSYAAFQQHDTPSQVITFKVLIKLPERPQPLSYTFAIDTKQQTIVHEKLTSGNRFLFDASIFEGKKDSQILHTKIGFLNTVHSTVPRGSRTPQNPRGGRTPQNPRGRISSRTGLAAIILRDYESTRSVLHQITHTPQGNLDVRYVALCTEVLRSLQNIQHIDPIPSNLRQYSQTQEITRIGEQGENFAALVKALQHDEKTWQAYLSWLQQLSPTEIDEVKILEGALREPMFAIVEKGKLSPAPVLSDGTLRFAALAAALFQPSMPQMMTLEEIENGIHPTRLRLLIELFRRRTATLRKADNPLQLMLTTHSPLLLSWLQETEYKHVFICKRDEETGESYVRSLADLPEVQSIIENNGLGELFAEGWMESIL